MRLMACNEQASKGRQAIEKLGITKPATQNARSAAWWSAHFLKQKIQIGSKIPIETPELLLATWT
jgi:hypothetical protein